MSTAVYQDESQELPSASPCGHESDRLVHRRGLAICADCGSFWDLQSVHSGFDYSAYGVSRHHFDEATGRNKVATLKRWLTCVDVDLPHAVVCEVGFGGGQCLEYLSSVSATAFGIEASAESLRHAEGLGIPSERLFRAEHLPPRLPLSVGLWVFQDSFEHIPDIELWMDWMKFNSTRDCRLLLVLPRAGSFSERWMGRFWAHRLPDHTFHWSREGLVEFFDRHGYQLAREFQPVKRISLRTVVNHLGLKLGSGWLQRFAGRVPDLGFWWNFGEMGLVFGRWDAGRGAR